MIVSVSVVVVSLVVMTGMVIVVVVSLLVMTRGFVTVLMVMRRVRPGPFLGTQDLVPGTAMSAMFMAVACRSIMTMMDMALLGLGVLVRVGVRKRSIRLAGVPVKFVFDGPVAASFVGVMPLLSVLAFMGRHRPVVMPLMFIFMALVSRHR